MSVHYDQTYYDVVKQGMSQTQLPTRILTDDQALFIQDAVVTLVGDGEEVEF